MTFPNPPSLSGALPMPSPFMPSIAPPIAPVASLSKDSFIYGVLPILQMTATKSIGTSLETSKSVSESMNCIDHCRTACESGKAMEGSVSCNNSGGMSDYTSCVGSLMDF